MTRTRGELLRAGTCWGWACEENTVDKSSAEHKVIGQPQVLFGRQLVLHFLFPVESEVSFQTILSLNQLFQLTRKHAP